MKRKTKDTDNITYGKTPVGQLVYDVIFTDLSEKYLARKHKMSAEDVRSARLKARKAILGRRGSKAQRERAMTSAKVLKKLLD